MTPYSIRSGWWVSTDNRFVACYDTKEEAIAHVKYQKEQLHSISDWWVQHIKITFEEQISFTHNN